ncbi:hypothetical protein [Leifsonia sp. NPDC058230]|uniref:hypothetical protein n=1 Tax=Leifsonia sp. NPDC058230 TaxID=3346391 RepID=UPI0036D9BE5D
MFGRRRHAAAVPAAPVPQLSEAQILELVHDKVAELIGERGEWTVSRRSQDDTDTIFHSVLAKSVTLTIATALFDAQRRLEAGETVLDDAVPEIVNAPQHLAPEVEAEPAASVDDQDSEPETGEPAAFGWEPAPITVWTDLRKPVTGEIPAILPQRTAA